MSVGQKIRCKNCGYVIQSMYRHDFKYCNCGSISVDGGGDYLKVSYPGGKSEDWIEYDIKEEMILICFDCAKKLNLLDKNDPEKDYAVYFVSFNIPGEYRCDQDDCTNITMIGV